MSACTVLVDVEISRSSLETWVFHTVLEIGSAMAVTDSEPNFRARAVALGLDEPTQLSVYQWYQYHC